MKARFVEFFESDNARLSMSRLLMFGSFIVTSAVMGWLTFSGLMNEGYFSMYLGAHSTTYLVGKGIDTKAIMGGGVVK